MKPYAGTPVHRSSDSRGKTHRYETSAPNEYPACAPNAGGGWESGPDASISKIRGNNRITVCRPKRG